MLLNKKLRETELKLRKIFSKRPAMLGLGIVLASGLLLILFNQDLTSRVLTLNHPVRLASPKTNFTTSEKPTFKLLTPQQTKVAVGETKTTKWSAGTEKIEASFSYEGSKEKFPALIKKESGGEFSVSLATDNAKHGDYKLEISASETFLYTRDLTQDFTWGVLAINTNKSVYKPGETAKLSVGVLDETGSTICDAKITLKIANPEKEIKTFTTTNKSITTNPDCGNTYLPDPDYAANYTIGKPGRYYMNVTAETKNGQHTLADYFEVEETSSFEVERVGFPTRIYPAAAYPVKLVIKANQGFKGQVSDQVQKSFKITEISNGGTTANDLSSFRDLEVSNQVKANDAATYQAIPQKSELLYMAPKENLDRTPTPITWSVDWKAGVTYTLSYTINFPPVSPEFYLMGPFTAGNFTEVRQWQVASDAVRCWDGGGADQLWQTVGNWSGNARPGSGDRVVFDNTFAAVTCAGATDASPNKNSDLTGTFAGTVQRVDMLNYTGTVTQTRSLALNTGGTNIGFVISAAGGSWTGSGAVDITQSATTGDFIVSNGTFTAGSGTIEINDNFTYSGGTLTATVGAFQILCGDGSTTMTGDVTLNDLNTLIQCNDKAISIANGTDIIVNGNMNLDSTGYASYAALNATTGTISLKGNLSAPTNNGVGGTAVITLNGTGTQTITGDDVNFPLLPGISINKSLGQVDFVETFFITGGFTYTQGTLNWGTSTLGFALGYQGGASETITGSISPNNFYFITGGNGFIFNIASGTTVTVNGNMVIAGGGCSGCSSIDGPGSINLKGDLTTISDGLTGDVVITMNGNTTQTITGATGGLMGLIPNMVWDTTGTINLVNTMTFGSGLTRTKGTINPGTSTVQFSLGFGVSSENSQTITGNIELGNVAFFTSGNGNTYTITSGSTLTATGTTTIASETTNFLNGPGSLILKGDLTGDNIDGDVPITFAGPQNQSLNFPGLIPDGTVTVAKTGGTLKLTANYSVTSLSTQDLTITSGVMYNDTFTLTVGDTFTIDGQFDQGTGNVLTGASGEITVGATGIYMNNGTGDITIGASGSGFANAGYVRFDGGGAQCGDSDTISIATTTATTARNWSGAGTYIIIDTTVRDANDSGITITAYNSTLTSNSDWVFNSTCPAYSNRVETNVQGGITIQGGTTLKSN